MNRWIPIITLATVAGLASAVAVHASGLTDPRNEAIDTSAFQPREAPPQGFRQVNRPGSVDLDAEYDLFDLRIPRDEIHTLLPRDAIPSLTDPELESAESAAEWLDADARIIDVTINGESVGVPLDILDYHEVANITVGGTPVAATYCPLCDSATVVARTLVLDPDDPDSESVVLEFGVSGALYNSNVLMYDRQSKSLFSQLFMKAVSGPYAGTGPDHLPVRIVSFAGFRDAHPGAELVSRDTGHQRPYEGEGYSRYFASDDLMVPVHGSEGLRDDMPKKTLGLGVLAGADAYFITQDALGEEFTLETPMGVVTARATDAGVEVLEAPEGVHTAQTFYYAWASFFKDAEVITE